MWALVRGEEAHGPLGQEREPKQQARAGVCGQKPQGVETSTASLPGSEQQACCYHVLKSLKPPLGFFLATGTAALVDGSSSAPRFLGRRAGRQLLSTPTPSLSSPAAPRPPSSRSLLNPRSASTWTHPGNGHQLPPHSRGCRVDVLAHPLAVGRGALAPWLGLAFLHCACGGCLRELCLLPLLGDLWWSRGVADQEPLGLDRAPRSPPPVARHSSPEHQPPRRGPQTPWWSRCGSPPTAKGTREQGWPETGPHACPAQPEEPASLSPGAHIP